MTAYYPGSNVKVRTYDRNEPLPPVSDEEKFDFGRPYKIADFGKGSVELYTLGVLASALNRQPVTLRKWEAEGFIPKPRMHTTTPDKRGKRRLYTKGQILGLVEIAREEGVLEPTAMGKWKPVGETRFREKAIQLFKTLEIE